MTLYTSKETRGFYDDEIHTTLPEDALEISAEEHATIINGQAAGMIIDWNEDGYAFLREPIPPTKEELNEQVALNRAAAYAAEADPLFYQYQRKDATKKQWLDKIAEIKARFPKVE